MESYTLLDGLKLPKVGFGTYKLNGAQGVRVIDSAIDQGYRLLDTAFNYENEGAVGEAVRRSSVPRSELLISSKLPGRHHDYHEAINTIEESLYRAGLDYYDLYLIHWPNPKEDHYVEAWQALIDAQKFGLVRSIGVSNFLPEHLDRLEKETGVMPVINQIELHPYFNQEDQRKYDQEHGILTQDWSPLGRASEMLQNPTLKKIAAKYDKNVGQLILRWELQLETLPIPKSSTPSRQAGNIDLFDFEIDAMDMKTINGLSKADGRLKNQDPAVYQEF
ncbi:aldo/keto reductase [Companilactobacillus sp.]|uniref:aldo/keto reductase n=1 Tax=Companilactobacillus sp. TaxID=2767905 RepID=UPI0025BBF1EF|nr:aldo/keto reductase [Companilactobacillus sp.]MCH4009861.1 aldo/keto reductase [Companilactobacillus sp.]MCH4052463.1 aldo/keto reductase [Companilactobacillus sp.]MCH4077803.1 aldo/keto reductase [Companilactobacillus sp.]MCH4126379.1 aldo/keto reductase [Companilactobacillus sp.]MCI1312701.1 aldo/keto reductase [Companilactobacillus sp.]